MRPRIYCLKCDISKYFDSVNHGILLGILHRKITDPDVLRLIEEIIRSHPSGIPIGNLTSQLFANVYLNELDQFVKRVLRERYYIRYMDDFLILGLEKRHLHDAKERIQTYLRDALTLELHPRKAQIFPADREIDFLGYVIRGRRRLLRKSTVERMRKKMKRYAAMVETGALPAARLENALASWRGYVKFADAYRLAQKLNIIK